MSLITSLFLSLAVFAAEPLQHFQPGDYKLSKGRESECGHGAFKLTDGGSLVDFGPRHSYDAKAYAGKTTSNGPGVDTGCIYENKADVKETGDETQIHSTEIERCNDNLRHTRIEIARIREGKVNLTVTQTGDDESFQYACSWEIIKAPAKK